MRISDWSSDVCSSDLIGLERVSVMQMSERGHDMAGTLAPHRADDIAGLSRRGVGAFHEGEVAIFRRAAERREVDRKSVVEGTSVSVRVDLGGRRILKKKKK